MFTTSHGNIFELEVDVADSSKLIYIGNFNGLYVYSDDLTADLAIVSGIFTLPCSFIQMSCTEIILADSFQRCLRKIDRSTGDVSEFSGVCKIFYLTEYTWPTEVARDKMNSSQLLVADGKFVRAVDINSGNSSMFTNSFIWKKNIWDMAQTENGDIYAMTRTYIFKIDYSSRDVALVAGSSANSEPKDGSLYESRFENLMGIELITEHALLAISSSEPVLRLVDMMTDKVTSIDVGFGLPANCKPYSFRTLHDSLYFGCSDTSSIIKFTCRYSLSVYTFESW